MQHPILPSYTVLVIELQQCPWVCPWGKLSLVHGLMHSPVRGPVRGPVHERLIFAAARPFSGYEARLKVFDDKN